MIAEFFGTSKKNLISIIFILLSSMTNINAQLYLSFGSSQEYNSNPFRINQGEESWISAINGDIEYAFEDFGIGYYGTFGQFFNIPERNFYNHQLGIWKDFENTSIGGYLEQRYNKEEYNIYDYFEAVLYLNHNLLLSENIFQINLEAAYNGYNQLSELNNLSLNASVQWLKSFETKTTFFLGSKIGYKEYLNQSTEFLPDSLADPETLNKTNYIDGIDLGKGGKGSGGKYSLNGSNQGFSDLSDQSVTQFSYWLRISQSLTSSTGIALQYTGRNILSGAGRYITNLSYNYLTESELFDDPMSYDGYTISGEITQVLPLDAKLSAGYYYSTKNYAAQGIFIDSENYDYSILRQDKLGVFSLSMEKSIESSVLGISSLNLNLTYQYLNNSSNSFYYKYDVSSFSFGIGIDF